jgi:thimet oligopeptidase
MLVDYTTVTPEGVAAAADDAIAAGEDLMAGLVSHEGPRTWADTMAPFDLLGDVMVRAFAYGPFMSRVHTDKAVRDAGQAAEEKLQKWNSDLVFRRDLYEAVEAYAATEEAAALTGEEARLLEFTRRDFHRAGHGLSEAERAEVQRLRTRLVELGVAFARNIDEYQDGLDLTREQLAGMPEEWIEGLSPGATEGTYRVSLDYPEYLPFMDEAEDRELRRQLQFKYFNKAATENTPILEEAVALRYQMARIFGEPSWAHYAMDEKMAKEPKAVEEMYAGIVPALTEKGHEELADMARALGSEDVQGWDFRYLHTLIRKQRYGVDPSTVAAYFPLQQVLDGMFAITSEVFGLTYRKNTEATVWHPDVVVYDLLDTATGEHLATFYMDLFPREGKFSHAAAFDIAPGWDGPDGRELPVTSIEANFTKPGADTPSLLRHNEVVTLFHEFGHVLHNSLARQARHVRFAGYNSEWDFVEAPSQIMEHWCWQADVLRRFAKHHRTGEPIPDELVDQLVAARDLHVALLTLRQVGFGWLDMQFHGPGETKDLHAITKAATELTLLPYQEGTFYPAGFGHLFGYDAGYYGYLWSKVFGDDMFSRFEAEGVLSPQVGADYRNKILGPGGSKEPMDMLRDFLGRDPNQQAFLRFIGIG